MRNLVATVVMVAAMVMSMTTTATEGQTPPPPCLSKLYVCKADLARPSAACCEVVKEEVKSDRDCLCTVVNDPDLLRSFNVTADQVRRLATACGVADDLSSCFAPSSNPQPSPPARSSANKGDQYMENWSGIFGFLSLSLICWSIIIS